MAFLSEPVSQSKLSLVLLSVSFLVSLFTHPPAAAAADNTNLIFKGCANQNFQDPSGSLSQNLKTLYLSLVQQSTQKSFSQTTSGQDQAAILGLFQCRGDLSTGQCGDCVDKASQLSQKLCPEAVAARVQLSGCYLRYEIVGFRQVPENQFLYKVCRSTQASGGTELEGKRDAAFQMAEEGVKGGSSLFYTGDYGSVYVLAQCEGDLGTADCANCVKTAFDRAKKDCADSISGQVYLQKCYISYSYYPNGVPNISSSPGTSRQHTQRVVAIAVGGVAGIFFLIVCLLFAKSVMKKRTEY